MNRTERLNVMNGGFAPIALFIFRRPVHTRRMIEHLKQCEGFEDSPIYVFCEGPRSESEVATVKETRRVAKDLLGDHAVYIEREWNLGLAKSIEDGISRLCNEFGKVIVIEDDLLVAPGFLTFLNAALDKYGDDQRVMQIGGHMFDVPELKEEREALFLPMTSSWGWATWKRAWDHFDMAATGWENRLQSLSDRKRFNLDGYANQKRMLEKQMRGELDTWDIQWYYAVFVRGGFGVYPPRTLVHNLGMDGSGSHGHIAESMYQAALPESLEFTLPDRVSVSRHKRAVYRAIWRFRFISRVNRVAVAVRQLLQIRRS